MKFLLAALFVATGVSATAVSAVPSAKAETGCLADYIVTTCLESEQKKVDSCGGAQWQCLCDGYQAVQTCFNNCPNDVRAAPARNQAVAMCDQASAYAAVSTPPVTSSPTAKSAASAATSPSKTSPSSASASPTDDSFTSGDKKDKDSGAFAVTNSLGSLVVAVAGAAMAML